MDKKQDKDESWLLKLGGDFIGSTTGASVGLGIAGPPGAIVGAAITPLLSEFAKRLLTSRQKARVGAVFILAKQKIVARLDKGDIINENFFKDSDDTRSIADESWEAILLHSQQEYEERKIIHYANLMANLAFESNIDKPHSNFLLKLSRNLSYRQLCLLTIFLNDTLKAQTRQSDYRGNSGDICFDLASVLHEIVDLFNYGIVGIPGDTILGPSDVNPGKMTVQGAGRELYTYMELDNISKYELEVLIQKLR